MFKGFQKFKKAIAASKKAQQYSLAPCEGEPQNFFQLVFMEKNGKMVVKDRQCSNSFERQIILLWSGKAAKIIQVQKAQRYELDLKQLGSFEGGIYGHISRLSTRIKENGLRKQIYLPAEHVIGTCCQNGNWFRKMFHLDISMYFLEQHANCHLIHLQK